MKKNITNFAKVLKEKDLAYDNSFEFIHCDKAKASELVVSKASELLHAGSDVQVITVFPEGDELSVKNLNNNIKFAFNPDTEGRTAIADSAISFTYNSGDRIRLTSEAHYMLGEKNYARSILFEENMPKDSICIISSLDGSHKQVLNKLGDTSIFEPGYAITPKKACGCEYEYVIIPIFDSPEFFLTRSELYSVITRAKDRVILIGDSKALDKALRRVPKKEKRNLISRVRYLQRCYSLKS